MALTFLLGILHEKSTPNCVPRVTDVIVSSVMSRFDPPGFIISQWARGVVHASAQPTYFSRRRGILCHDRQCAARGMWDRQRHPNVPATGELQDGHRENHLHWQWV